jgi:hypothetical protein
MADKYKADQVQDKIRQAMEKLGEALDRWLKNAQPVYQPIPVPVDRRPYRRRMDY